MTEYAELQVTTNFSFLRGASRGEELVETAQALGIAALGVADRNSLAGVVRAHLAAKKAGLKLLVGARLETNLHLEDVTSVSVLAYPTDRAAYGRLCRLLTRGMRTADKGDCHLSLGDILEFGQGQVFIAVPPDRPDVAFEDALARLAAAFPENTYLAAHHHYRGDDRRRIGRLAGLAASCGAPMVATNDVHYHVPGRRPLQDVLTCIREKCTIAEAGWRLDANAERHLKSPGEMARLFRDHPDAIARTMEIANRCTFSLDELAYEYPDEPVPPGKTPQEHLTDLAWAGADWRYPDGVSDKIKGLIRKELILIEKLGYAPYFLTVHDIVHFARSRDILCQGRGSAANSVVCYCIGITSVDPVKVDLLFERFVSEARKEPPDIDVDFEHERREEVIQYIYERYGRHRAGLAATVISYRARSAVREVGKAMGLTADVTSALAKTVWGHGGSEIPAERVKEAGLDLNDPHLARTVDLTEELLGFPRHLSQHVGGFILTRGPLEETVPIGNGAMPDRTFIEWDKDDIDALGILKVDVLGLGMLTCIRKCFDLIHAHYGKRYTLATLPAEDPAVYDMLCRADAVGVFQVESRAQMNMLPRLKPRKYYDLVIEVAIVRPGPIQGDMVHPYLRRRDGKEPVVFPSPGPEFGPPDELERVLGKTMGVPLFQEQAMRIAIDAAKFTGDEANDLRRAMATFRRVGTIGTLQDKMVGRMVQRGYDEDFANRCFDQIKGFGEYGFPESHAASFALLVYVSAWIKHYYPDVFCAGLLNAQPMGFYAPAQIVRDARDHGAELLPPDVNRSDWDNTLQHGREDVWAVRLGLRQVDGIGKEVALKIEEVRASGGNYASVNDLWERTRLPVATIEKLAAADAFRSIGLDRRQALWDVRALKDSPDLPLFQFADAAAHGVDVPVALPAMPLPEHVVADYQTLHLSLKGHPLSFLRAGYTRTGIIPTAALFNLKDGDWVSVAGIVLVRQRPGTAKGVVFITLEDETGVANAVVWKDVMETHRKIVMGARLMLIRGPIQREGDIIHIVAKRLENLSGDLLALSEETMPAPFARADEVINPIPDRPVPAMARRHPRDARIILKSRDFH